LSLVVESKTPEKRSSSNVRPSNLNNMLSNFDDRTTASRNGLGLISDNKSNKSRAQSIQKNASAVKNYLDKVGITSDAEVRKSTSRVLAHQTSEATFMNIPLSLAARS